MIFLDFMRETPMDWVCAEEVFHTPVVTNYVKHITP